MTDQQDQIALTLVPGVGVVLIRQLISYCGSASEVFRAPVAKLLKIPGIGDATARALGKPEPRHEAETVLRQLEKLNARALFYTDPDFPTRLKTLYDAPALLYQQGAANLNATRTLGIVGTRQATEYGRRITEELVQGLQPLGVTIVSGLAYGIDIAAHRASVVHQLPTIGVMASGLDIIYPATHHKTAQDMLALGGLLTESRPGTKPEAHLFPARNRVIAGLSDAVIVVEAAAKGGALITAEYANNYHREVFAVPGSLAQGFSVGCNKLIRENKAQIYTRPDDIVQALNWDQTLTGKTLPGRKPATDSPLPVDFTAEESQVVALLRQVTDMHIDELSWKTQVPMGKLAALLLNLEFRGFVRTLPGKKYQVIYV
jgi:DNA processing protein